MHRRFYGFGGKHRRQAVGEVDHRVAELPELIEGGDLDLFARDELRDPFLVIDLGEARLVVFAHRPRLRVLRRAKNLRVIFRLLAAPVSGNAKVIKAGKLSFVCSGPRAVFDEVAPLLKLIAPAAMASLDEVKNSTVTSGWLSIRSAVISSLDSTSGR